MLLSSHPVSLPLCPILQVSHTSAILQSECTKYLLFLRSVLGASEMALECNIYIPCPQRAHIHTGGGCSLLSAPHAGMGDTPWSSGAPSLQPSGVTALLKANSCMCAPAHEAVGNRLQHSQRFSKKEDWLLISGSDQSPEVPWLRAPPNTPWSILPPNMDSVF